MKTKSLAEIEKDVNKELGVIDIAELKEGENEKRQITRQRKAFYNFFKD